MIFNFLLSLYYQIIKKEYVLKHLFGYVNSVG